MKAVRDGENVIGLWVQSEAGARDSVTIGTWCTMQGASDAVINSALAGRYRVVSNSFDNSGGYFCMFGNEPAPGETATGKKGTRSGCFGSIVLLVLSIGVASGVARWLV